MRKLDKFQEKNDTVVLIGPDNSLSQTFRPAKNNLSGVKILVYNPRLGGNITYDIEIKDQDNEVLRKATISESNLGWAYQFRYDFSPIQNSANKTFRLSISYGKESAENSKELSHLNSQLIKGELDDSQKPDIRDKIQKNYLGWAYSYKDGSKDGSAYINQDKLKGDFVFQSYYSTDLRGFVTDSVYGFKSKISGDSSFFIFYFVLISGFLTVLIKKYFFNASIKPK